MAKKKFGLSSTLNKNKTKKEEVKDTQLSAKIPLKRVSKNYDNVGKRVDEIHKEESDRLENKTSITTTKNKKVKTPLVRITIDVPVEVHKSLKMKMAQEGTTIRKYILNLLHKDLKINP